MVSLERAQQCLGRRLVHDYKPIRGTVERTDANDVWVKLEGSEEVIPCIPAHLTWVSTLSADLKDAITGGVPYHGVQVGYAPEVFRDDPDAGFPDMGFSNLGIVYSSASANDDGEDRALFAVAPMLRRVLPLSITANPETAFEIEEVLGWKIA